MASARRELLRDQLVSLFGAISVDNGYRTDPFPVQKTMLHQDQIVNHPTICVGLGPEYLDFGQGDMPRANLLTSYIQVEVRGYYADEMEGVDEDIWAAETAGEPLLHDLKQCWAALLTTNIVTSPDAWIVSNVKNPEFIGPVPLAKNRGMVSIRFVVKFLRQSSTFS
jgi:hypothetical protein